MKTVIKDRTVDLEKLISDLTEEEFKRVQVLQSAKPSKCTGMSCGSLYLCAIMCEAMHCDNFEHSCSVNVGCAAQIKCSGFTGDGDSCKPFLKIPAE